jgi:hypothetical protein
MRSTAWKASMLAVPLIVVIIWLWFSGATPATSDLAARHEEILRTCARLTPMPVSAYVVNWAVVVVLGAVTVAAIAGLRLMARTFGRLPSSHSVVAVLQVLLAIAIVAAILTIVSGLLSMPDFYQQAVPMKSICRG